MDKEQQERFRRAVDEKAEQEEQKATAAEHQLDADERPPGVDDPRKKSSKHGQVTADKWNQ